MSDQKLTGYDNVDANPEAKVAGEGALDQEVFLYDASTGRLVCASCNPDGQPPHGVFDTENAGEGEGLTVDRPELWNGQLAGRFDPGLDALRGQPRSPSTSRAICQTTGACSSTAPTRWCHRSRRRTREENVEGKTLQVGVENVYEYEPQRDRQLPAGRRLRGADLLGHLRTRIGVPRRQRKRQRRVLPHGREARRAGRPKRGYDIYDARSCGTSGNRRVPASRKIHPPPECTGEECRPAVSGQPSFALPPSFVSGPSSPGEHPVWTCRTTTENGAETAHARAEARQSAKGVSQAQAKEAARGVRTQGPQGLRRQGQADGRRRRSRTTSSKRKGR